MKTVIFLFLGILSLFIGGLLYIFYRPDTIIYSFVSCFIALSDEVSWNNPFVLFYIPDALWAFSLGCFLSILLNNLKLIGSIIAGYGILWELAQALSVISGTADWIDIWMYVIAAFAVVGINLLFKEKST